MTFYMTKSSVNQVFLAMFNSYFDITRGSNPWGPIEDERLCRSCFFCHSWAPEPRERRGLATEKKPGGSKEVRYDEALVFSTSKISKPKASKNRKKTREFRHRFLGFHLSFSDFHGDLHRSPWIPYLGNWMVFGIFAGQYLRTWIGGILHPWSMAFKVGPGRNPW